MLRNLKVGTKLFVILAAPMVVVLVLVAIGVRERQDAADGARRVEQLASFAAATSDLATQLQRESILSAQVAGGGDANVEVALSAQRTATDSATARYEALLAQVDPASSGGTLAESVRLAATRLDSLSGTRGAVDSGAVQGYALVGLYDGTVETLVATNAALSQEATDPELLRGLDTAVQVERIAAAQGTQGGLLTAATSAGAFVDTAGARCPTVLVNCESWDRTEEATSALDQSTQAFEQGGSTPAQKQAVQNAAGTATFDQLAATALDQGAATNELTTGGTEMADAALAAQEGLASVDADLLDSVVNTARALGDDASQAVTWYLLGGVGGLAVAFAIAVAVTRSVTTPLARLTGAAHRLSEEQLPALVARIQDPEDTDVEELAETFSPIAIDSRDEIGQLARAFNDLQEVTVEVAEEQHRLLRKGIGDLFVNLARRNQSLLDRQIAFIDQLEENERDPAQLENLFRLDHLATRMKRNAESLLVLAGAEPVRRRGRPVPVADVVRVAIGEVEQFSRLQLLALDDATLAGNVGVDLAHLLSELMENATSSSPPDTDVEVLGQRTDKNGYVVTITDRGIGMTAEQLAEANALLARPPAVGLTLSRSLGFTVVGRLAARIGCRVRVEPGPSGGVRALVDLPFSLVEYDDATTDADDDAGHGRPASAPAGIVTRRRPALRRTAPVGAAPGADIRASDVAERPEPTPPVEPPPAPRREPHPVTAAGLPARRPAATGESAAPAPTEIATPTAAVEPSPEPAATTASGLVRRTPQAAAPRPAAAAEPTVTRTSRSPEEVRRMLSRYRSGLDRGRGGDGQGPPLGTDVAAPEEEKA